MRAKAKTPAWFVGFLLTAALTSCHSSTLGPCRELVAAAPPTWPEHWERVQALGPGTAPTLIQALREDGDGAGRQAAVHLLGEWRNRKAAGYLLELAAGDSAEAAEAALALGKLGDPGAIGTLVAVVRDHRRAILARTAAACALLDLGEVQSAVPLLRAVLLAATPYGTELQQQHGLPNKTRWAHERYMVIESLRRFAGGETFGLDEDASWPQLRAGVETLDHYLAERQSKKQPQPKRQPQR